MGMYSINESFDSSVGLTDTLESIMEDANLQPAEGDNFEEMAMDVVIDTQRNYNSIMESIGIMELNYLETNGKEMVYTEGTLSDMYQAVKKFILKIWDKIKAFFKRFIMIFDSYYKEDKAFVDKYRKQIFEGKNLSDFEFKGYKFDLNIPENAAKMIAVTAGGAGIGSNLAAASFNKEAIKKDSENFDDNFEKFRGVVLKAAYSGASGTYTDSEFKKELHDQLRGGDGEKEDLDGEWKDVNAAVNRLVGSKYARKGLKKMFSESKKGMDKAIKEIESAQRDIVKVAEKRDKQDHSLEAANFALRLFRDSKALMAIVDGACMQAMKDFSRQDKSMLVSIMRYSPKKEGALGESGSMGWEHEDEMARSFLGNIQLV